MSATRNPFYQLPGGADLPGDVRVSDTADASKTAAGGWAASPAAIVPIMKQMGVRVSNFEVFNEESSAFSFHFRAKATDLRVTFIICTVHQSGYVSVASIIATLSKPEINVVTNFISSAADFKVTSATISKDGDVYTIFVKYNIGSIWGPAFVFGDTNYVIEIS